MTRTIAIALLGAAVVLGTAYYANSQQMDGRNCEWAYKKLSQHRNYGVCQEQGDHNDNKDSQDPTGDGEHSIRDKAHDFIDRLRD